MMFDFFMFSNATPKRALLYLSLPVCLFGLGEPFDLFGALSELSLTRVPVDNFRVGGVFQKVYFLVNFVVPPVKKIVWLL